ncbi:MULTISPECIES: hypothetical protein [unclassified Methanosarcina]|uniref:hypothetical protein n=1 Tax=unclassified Methanosarcina TaxID=2644672 RepID=UPI0012E0666E|nr:MULTISPECIES: hypothetical protein [unclassified Methanosarcina]
MNTFLNIYTQEMTGINSIILAGGSGAGIWPFSRDMCPMKIIEVQFGELMEEGRWKV